MSASQIRRKFESHFLYTLIFFFPPTLENDGVSIKRRDSTVSPLPLGNSSSTTDDETIATNSVEIKQERMDCTRHEEDSSSVSSGQPLKRSRTEVADAESNTTHSGKYTKAFSFHPLYRVRKNSF